jgi:hypothetical protein
MQLIETITEAMLWYKQRSSVIFLDCGGVFAIDVRSLAKVW